MPIVSTDIQTRLSGGSTNSSAASSIGGVKSTQPAPSQIFPNASSSEALSGRVTYRCVYAHNNHGSLSLENAVAWLSSNSSGQLAIGVGTSAVNGTEAAVASETIAPTNVAFSPAASEGAALSIGTIPPGQHRAIWIRRTIPANSTGLVVSATIRVKGDTQP